MPTINISKPQVITGNYHLKGVNETISGIEFRADFTFRFFYSYSAIERSGSGTYTLKNDTVVLNIPFPGDRDFELVSCNSKNENGILIKITDPNPVMIKYVSCCIVTQTGMHRAQTNEHGIAAFRNEHAGSILLIHLLFPDRTSIFQLSETENNYFEFTINPSIADIHFNNLILKKSGNNFIGGHPLIAGDQFIYSKD